MASIFKMEDGMIIKQSILYMGYKFEPSQTNYQNHIIPDQMRILFLVIPYLSKNINLKLFSDGTDQYFLNKYMTIGVNL